MHRLIFTAFMAFFLTFSLSAKKASVNIQKGDLPAQYLKDSDYKTRWYNDNKEWGTTLNARKNWFKLSDKVKRSIDSTDEAKIEIIDFDKAGNVIGFQDTMTHYAVLSLNYKMAGAYSENHSVTTSKGWFTLSYGIAHYEFEWNSHTLIQKFSRSINDNKFTREFIYAPDNKIQVCYEVFSPGPSQKDTFIYHQDGTCVDNEYTKRGFGKNAQWVVSGFRVYDKHGFLVQENGESPVCGPSSYTYYDNGAVKTRQDKFTFVTYDESGEILEMKRFSASGDVTAWDTYIYNDKNQLMESKQINSNKKEFVTKNTYNKGVLSKTEKYLSGKLIETDLYDQYGNKTEVHKGGKVSRIKYEFY